jgi:hypothetical protein
MMIQIEISAVIPFGLYGNDRDAHKIADDLRYFLFWEGQLAIRHDGVFY